MTEYVALQRILAPNTYVTAYQAGDTLLDQVVKDWGLVVGEQVELVDGFQPPRPDEESTDRAAWEAYVIGQGKTLVEARVASLEELRGFYLPPVVELPAHDLPANAAAEGVAGTAWQPGSPRPSETALKQEWVDYTIGAGADPDWARAKDTTKDDLIGWKPSGDQN